MNSVQCTEKEMNRLVGKYRPMMLHIGVRYLSDYDLAEDAVQDAFLKAYRAWKPFDRPEYEKNWMMCITANVCRDYLRTPWMKRVIPMEQYPEPEDRDGAVKEGGCLVSAVEVLDPKYRQIIRMYYYCGMKTAEIAQTLNIPCSTVCVRLCRARKNLRKALSNVSQEEL